MENIETNSMGKWTDMAEVKKNLWDKLHGAKTVVANGATQLAQIMKRKAKQMARFMKVNQLEDKNFVQIDSQDGLNTVQLSQTAESQLKHKMTAEQVSTKQMNTQRTMILYFCIMTVLMCCCLGRCLVVPLSQASRYELNARKHIAKLDKNAFLQQEVV
jgi:hypothetical protein